jgi:pimeloyl-ACP methyl ester carboxylesterase
MMQGDGTTDALRLPYLEPPERAFSMVREAGVFREDTVVADDGVPLTVLEAGDPARPAVLLVNALGVSCLFLSRLAQVLARDWHVLTWETRGLPDFSASDGRDLSVGRHAADAASVLARKAGGVRAVVAYCSGANIAVHALVERIVAADRLCIVSPSMEIPTVEARTDYQRTMLPIWQKIDRSGPRFATLVRAMIRQNWKPWDGTLQSELHHLNNLPFRSSQSTHRYALMQAACLRFDWPARLACVTVPTLVLHGAEDDIIHEETSAAVAAAVDGASLAIIPNCGHFAIYTSDELHGRLCAFLGSRAGGVAPTIEE